jgi:ABC-type branched-subunit amino acid transport system substrate-binding protein/outer membrane protein assembly factor BamD (BamD/ComL family)
MTTMKSRILIAQAGAGILAVLLISGTLQPTPAIAQQTPAVEPTGSPDADAQELLDKAVAAAGAGDLEQAQLTYQLLLTTYPQSSLKDQVYFGLAQIDQQQQNYANAAVQYQKLINEFPASPLIEKARHALAEAYISLGQYDGAITLLERERSLSPDPAARQALTDRIVEVLLKKKDHVQAIQELLKQEESQEGEKRAVEDRVQELIDQSSRAELKELISQFSKGYPGDAALLKLADLYESSKEYFEAERELRRFLSTYPKHRAVSKVRSRLIAIKQIYLGNQHLIGVMLPLSGRMQPFGQQVLNGVRLAMDPAFNPVPDKFVGVVVKNTEGESSALQTGLDELAREYRVSAIIGPMLSRQVAAAAPRADAYRIPLMTPAASQDWSKPWKFVLRNSVTNRQQASEIASYALNTLHLKRFCILHSDDGYGMEMMRIFSEEISKSGGEIIARASYDPQATDFGPQIKSLKETDLSKYGVLGPPPEQKGEVREYTPGFDAVFLPADYDQAGLIAAQLAFYNIQGVTLLGTNGWDSQDLFRIGGKYIDGGIFVDGFFPGSTEPQVQSFVERYRNRFEEEPTLLAAQGYDAVSLVLRALQQGAVTGEAVRDFLGRVRNFSGVTGPITYTPDGDLAKRLYVIQAKDGKFVQLN